MFHLTCSASLLSNVTAIKVTVELPCAGASAHMRTFAQTTHCAGAPSVPLSCMHIVFC